MAIKKRVHVPVVRSTGQRVNHYGESSDNSRGFSDLEYTINKIAEKVDTPTGTVEKTDDMGNAGEFRVVKDKKTYFLEIRTEDGWIRSDNSTASGFSLKGKAS